MEKLKMTFLSMLLFMLGSSVSYAQDGYAMVNGTTTGGSGGSTVTVSNAQDFKTYAESGSSYIINVSGTIDLGGSVDVGSNTTIQGANSSAKIIGTLDCGGSSNIIIRNLTITSPYGDGITIWTSDHIYVHHVTFVDCSDGMCDINHQSDYVTVSWCKFYYQNQTSHKYVMILGGDPYDAPGDKNHVTVHHNWFAQGCDQRMPSGSYSNAHIYNNYFNASGNGYGTNCRAGTHWLVENNYYEDMEDPCYHESGGIMEINGNTYDNCTGLMSSSNGNVSVPYSYSLTSTGSVPSTVQSGAGIDGASFGGGGSITEGTYSIIARHSGKAMEVYDFSTVNGGNVVQWDYWGGDFQKWRIISVGGGYYRIENVGSSRSLDVESASTANGANIQQWGYGSGGDHKEFSFQDVGSGYYRITPRHSNKCIDVEDISTADGANIHQWEYLGGQNQQWQLNYLGGLRTASGVTQEVLSTPKTSLIYPNPTSGKVSIALDQFDAPVSISITDLGGKVVFSGMGTSEMDLSYLKKGIYLVNLNAAGVNVSEKLIIR